VDVEDISALLAGPLSSSRSRLTGEIIPERQITLFLCEVNPNHFNYFTNV